MSIFRRHHHSGPAVGTTHYESLMGPQTIIQYRCDDCGHVWTSLMYGYWTLAQLNGEVHE